MQPPESRLQLQCPLFSETAKVLKLFLLIAIIAYGSGSTSVSYIAFIFLGIQSGTHCSFLAKGCEEATAGVNLGACVKAAIAPRSRPSASPCRDLPQDAAGLGILPVARTGKALDVSW